MPPCPTNETLMQVLAGQGTNDWHDHIARCTRCQSVLDRAADDPELRSWHHDKLNASVAVDVARFLDRIQSQTPGAFACTNANYEAAGYPFLNPASRPNDIGILGSYHIERELGRGGMGVVFRAFDPTLNRAVAIKVLRPAADDADTRSRLLREARALAKLKHSNIVHVHACAETTTGLPYLVLEFVDGPNLAEQIRKHGALSPRHAAELVAAIADGLQSAHELGLIHRDVKPANILLAPTPKLTDFGLVRGDQTTATASAVLVGTPAYMSPEQIRDPAHVDARTDIYSLGATLYECLTGDVPFRGSSAMVLRQVVDDEPRPPRRLNEKVPRDLEVICLKALAKEPHRRYESARDFAADLRHYLNGESICARPAGRIERIVRWSRRQPLPAALSAALIVVTLLGLGGIIWQWRSAVVEAARANDQRTQAEENLRDAVEVVDQFLTRVSEDKLKDTPGFEPLRRQLLEDALGYYERFLQKPSASPELFLETAKAATRAAGLVTLLRPPSEAIVAWDRAVDAWARFHNDPKHRDDWLSAQLNRALALTQADRISESILAFQSLSPALIQRATEHPKKTKYQRDLASVSAALANNYSRLGRQGDAQQAYHEARQAFQKLVEAEPENANYLRRLASCLYNMAKDIPGREALPLLDEALAVQGRSVQLTNRPPAELFLLARIECQRGMAFNDLGRRDDEQSALRSACVQLEQLVAGSPAVHDYRDAYARALHRLGIALTNDKPALAAESIARAKTQYELLMASNPSSDEYAGTVAAITDYLQKVQTRNTRKD